MVGGIGVAAALANSQRLFNLLCATPVGSELPKVKPYAIEMEIPFTGISKDSTVGLITSRGTLGWRCTWVFQWK